jgi:hypothetical protein
MNYKGGYITDVNELYIFARSVGDFCDNFRNGCCDVASAAGGDYDLGYREMNRIAQWVSECESHVAQVKKEYDDYVAQDDYDSRVADSMKYGIEQAEADLNKARNDSILAEQLFYEFRLQLDKIHTTASNYAHSVHDLGNDAVRAVNSAADFIANYYNK